MTSDRAYRRALPHAVTTHEIKNCAGRQFDPEVSREFVQAIEQDRAERIERKEPVPD